MGRGGQLIGGQGPLIVAGVQMHATARTAGMGKGMLLFQATIGQRTVRSLAGRQVVHVVVYFARDVWRGFPRVMKLKQH